MYVFRLNMGKKKQGMVDIIIILQQSLVYDQQK